MLEIRLPGGRSCRITNAGVTGNSEGDIVVAPVVDGSEIVDLNLEVTYPKRGPEPETSDGPKQYCGLGGVWASEKMKEPPAGETRVQELEKQVVDTNRYIDTTHRTLDDISNKLAGAYVYIKELKEGREALKEKLQVANKELRVAKDDYAVMLDVRDSLQDKMTEIRRIAEPHASERGYIVDVVRDAIASLEAKVKAATTKPARFWMCR